MTAKRLYLSRREGRKLEEWRRPTGDAGTRCRSDDGASGAGV